MFNSYEPSRCRPRLRHADRQLPAAAGRLRRPELLQARPERALRDPRRQQRRRQGRHHLPVPLQQHAARRRRCTIGGTDVAIPLTQSGQITAPNAAASNVNETFTVDIVRGDRRTGTRGSVTNATRRQQRLRQAVDNIGTKTIPNYAAYAAQHIYTRQHPRLHGAGQGLRRPAQGPVRGQPRRDLRPAQRPGRGRLHARRGRVPARQLEEGRRHRRPRRHERHDARARGADELPASRPAPTTR